MTMRYFKDKSIKSPKQIEQIVVTFIYPDLPPRECSPNARVNFREKAAVIRALHDDVSILLREGRIVKPEDCYHVEKPIVEVAWGLPDKRRRDWDNLIASTKPIIAVLVREQILADDTVRDYTPRYCYFESPKDPKTIIKVIRMVDDD